MAKKITPMMPVEEIAPVGLEDFWEPQGAASEPSPDAAPAPAVDPLDPLRSEMRQVQTALNYLMTNMNKAPLPALPTPVHNEAAGAMDIEKLLENPSFFTKEDGTLLLTSPNPEMQLNSLFSKFGKTLLKPLLETVTKQQKSLDDFRSEQSATQQRVESERKSNENMNNFYTAYPDLKPLDRVVRAEAQAMAQESQTNPYAFVGKSDTEVFGMLAARTRGAATVLLKAMGATLPSAEADEPAEPAALSPNTRHQATFMERGSGSRVQAPTVTKDPNARALKEMGQHMNRGRR